MVAPNEFQGSVIGGINKRSGIIQNTDMSDDGSGCVVQADVPLAQVSVIDGTFDTCVEQLPALYLYCAASRRLAIAWASPLLWFSRDEVQLVSQVL